MVGCPGNGKTTLARTLAARLGLAHIELDGLFHRPGWESTPEPEFRAALAAAIDAAPQGWVTCGNYLTASDAMHLRNADTAIWLDLPRFIVTGRTLRRTIRRAVRRERLFGLDLREPLTNFTRWDPEKNVIRWAWVHQPLYRSKYQALFATPEMAHLDVVHLENRGAVAAFLDTVPDSDG